jgi:hypothetical protein
MPDTLYCGQCGKPCEWEKVDTGIGAYEFWGQKCVDKNIEVLSTCCEADIYTNAELTVNYEHEDYTPEREDYTRYDDLDVMEGLEGR